jgi:hypothetical protein
MDRPSTITPTVRPPRIHGTAASLDRVPDVEPAGRNGRAQRRLDARRDARGQKRRPEVPV